MMRKAWVAPDKHIALNAQCQLASVSRAAVYVRRKPKLANETELLLCRLIDEEYTRHPFYGSRKMVRYLHTQGHGVNRKRVQRMMRLMGLAGMAPGPNTSKGHPEHKLYPYLLRGVPIVRVNQVWSTDITYIRLAHGFVYLVAVIDWYSRKVLSWRISNSMEAVFCVDCLEDALRAHGTPEIFNSDQGSQFTSDAFTSVLKHQGITISMDGRGRAFDNIFVERFWRSVKHEDVYLKGHFFRSITCISPMYLSR
jgi:putative transposase